MERSVALTLERAPPRGATHRSTRSMARRAGTSRTAAGRFWRAFGPRPRRAETSKPSSGPAFVEKARDSVGLYLAPPERALVLCVDEKPRIQAARGAAPALPTRPAQAERRTHDHRCHGAADLLAALDVKVGAVVGARGRRRRAVGFRAFPDQVEAAVPADLGVHLAPDDLKTRKTRLAHDWSAKRPRFRLHSTPTGASWPDLVECWFALPGRRRLARGASTGVGDLEAVILARIADTSAEPKPFVWTKAADDILAGVARFCQRTPNSSH